MACWNSSNMCIIQSHASCTEQRHFTWKLLVFSQDVRQQGDRHCTSSLGVSESQRVLVQRIAVNVRSLLSILNECVENVGLRVHRTRVLSNTYGVYCTLKFHRWSVLTGSDLRQVPDKIMKICAPQKPGFARAWIHKNNEPQRKK
jgi:hypothetical protein